ncbi:ribonuclease Y [Rubrobacter radiotolerans]|uniref:Ribonuclease Y n=1 Tax=Rubrobacter radiotolerans TaxID=42256 RepID=A0A023X2Z8_RUBRA|nr:ribonuclease Y [Rubrobacter radiotolerans]AHY46713.1 ribonuclease Y [Rubrobacter radiotolerans]MDX5894120.1 ribonuclease Y [Rubrobacter radiotolerans]SMC05254.1 ribonucrease Y [Rubrobacter radiotolerans DSM 5868]
MNFILAVIGLVVGLGVGVAVGFFVARSRTEARLAESRSTAEGIIEQARSRAETIKRESEVEAREAAVGIRAEAEDEARARRNEISRVEERLDKREAALGRRESELDRRQERLSREEGKLAERAEKLKEREDEQVRVLEELSGLTKADAESRLLSNLEVELEDRLGRMVRDRTMEAEELADFEARKVIATSMERLASDLASESTVKAISLSSDDMKGRIIGREGRNIRAFEAATGVDVIIDDTPETVVISCFDPVRRETARISMERLVQDGRIHPGRIEQIVAKAKKEVEKEMRAAGRQALFDAKITGGMHGDLQRLLGALKFRTSYGQNVLAHSVEVANLAGMMAQELGANVKIARRAALLHDVGKAIDHEVEGTHALIGGRFAKKCGESEDIVRAISAHHHEIEMETVEDVLVAAADAVSAARPGARRETTEIYIERLRALEDIALGHRGVDKAYAIQAGREIRVMVQPQEVDDRIAAKLALDISRQIETDLEYPGQIKVTVIRESRVSEVAK